MDFKLKLKNKWDEGKFVCVGLDQGSFEFDKKIIDDTFDLVCAYKLNSAFYESFGAKGWQSLQQTIDYIKKTSPDLAIILDAKRADIFHTNSAYAKSAFETLGVDAITINPYPGKSSLQPFLDYKDKGIIVWIAASNMGSDKFQDVLISDSKKPLYQYIAEDIAKNWNENGNLSLVVGATIPNDLKIIRKIVGNMPILVPGIGTQGGDLEQTLKNGLDSNKQGLIISSSRTIINAQNPRKAALNLHNQIQEIIKNV